VEEITRLARPEILAMKPYSSARKEGRQQNMSVFLDANENPYPPFPATGESEGLNRYPEPQPQHLVDLFAAHYAVPREQLLITRGADEAIDLLVRAFCAAGKDAVLINPPTFGMYDIAAQIQDAAVYAVPLRPDDPFQLDVERILATCRERPNVKLVFVCSPNNPTGNLLRRRDILALCSKLFGKVLVVADEAYVEFSGSPSLCAEVPAQPNLVVLRTLSKEHSLAGERCGVTVAHPDVISIIGRILAPYPLTASTVRAVTQALSPEGRERARANIRLLIEQRERVAGALARSPGTIRVHPSDANYLLVETPEPALLIEMMEKAGVKIRDRSRVPRIEGCVRISIGTAEQNELMLRTFEDYALRCRRPDHSGRAALRPSAS
jgi:histidinol-phosphate aminotransferase